MESAMEPEHPAFFFAVFGAIFVFVLAFSTAFTLVSTGKRGLVTGNAVFRDNTAFPDTPLECNDSDGGIFSVTAGSVAYRAGGDARALADACKERSWGRPVVVEYYCREGKARIISIPCRHGCREGACLSALSTTVSAR